MGVLPASDDLYDCLISYSQRYTRLQYFTSATGSILNNMQTRKSKPISREQKFGLIKNTGDNLKSKNMF